MAKCCVCGNDDAFIALGKWREPNLTFSDIISRQCCWECYVAVVHPVDRKLANAKERIRNVFNRPLSYIESGRLQKDRRNIEAWEQAIQEKQLQRSLFNVI